MDGWSIIFREEAEEKRENNLGERFLGGMKVKEEEMELPSEGRFSETLLRTRHGMSSGTFSNPSLHRNASKVSPDSVLPL